MRALLTCLLIGCAAPAQAMNWEGHDDWMASSSPARLYEQAVPHASPPRRPATSCSAAVRVAVDNPYEQIPLARPDCRGPQEQRELDR